MFSWCTPGRDGYLQTQGRYLPDSRRQSAAQLRSGTDFSGKVRPPSTKRLVEWLYRVYKHNPEAGDPGGHFKQTGSNTGADLEEHQPEVGDRKEIFTLYQLEALWLLECFYGKRNN